MLPLNCRKLCELQPWSDLRRGVRIASVTFLLVVAMQCFGLLGCSATSLRTGTRDTFAGSRSASQIRVGTYNIFVGSRNLNKTAQVIRQMHADVIALQEVVPHSAKTLDREFAGEYPYRYFSGGLGMMSRFPMRHPRFEKSRYGINGFLFAEIEHPNGSLQMVNVHLDPLRIWTLGDKLTVPLQIWSRQGTIHRKEIAQIFGALKSNQPTILLGDFNCANNAATKRLGELGLIDSSAEVTRKENCKPTLHYSILGIRSGHRIDFIFHDRTFHTSESQVVPGQPSDHDAVWSSLSWNPFR